MLLAWKVTLSHFIRRARPRRKSGAGDFRGRRGAMRLPLQVDIQRLAPVARSGEHGRHWTALTRSGPSSQSWKNGQRSRIGGWMHQHGLRRGKASSAPVDHADERRCLKEHDGARDAPEQPPPAGPPQGPQEPNRQPEDDEVEGVSGKRPVEKDRTSRATKHCGVECPGQTRPPFERDEPFVL